MLDLLLERLSLTDSVLLLNSVGCSQCRPAYVEALQSSLESVASKMCAGLPASHLDQSFARTRLQGAR